MSVGLFTGIGFLVGMILGSFVKALADRSTKEVSFWGRSYCPYCKHKLGWYDLFPVFSYLFLNGKCRYCHHKIPLEYPLVELGMGVLSALVFFTSTPSDWSVLFNVNGSTLLYLLALVFKLFVVAVLVMIFLTDLQTGLIPNRIVYPATLMTVLYLLISSAVKSWFFYQELLKTTLGPYLIPPYSNYIFEQIERLWMPGFLAVLSALIVTSFFALLIIITKGRGMGWGDVKYVFFLGLALGFPSIALGIFLAFLLGALLSVALIFTGKKRFGQTVPFGPFLSLGALIALLWGDQIISWYLNSFSVGGW